MPSKRLNENFQIASLRFSPESYMMEPEGGETNMKDKRYIRLNPNEMRLTIDAMMNFTTTLFTRASNSIDVDWLLVIY